MISSANFRSISRWILALLLCLGWQFVSAASLAAVSGAKPEGNSAANAGPFKGQTVPQFVYVTNRDSNDISAFRVESETYALHPVVGSPFATGAGPRAAAASADGQFLFVANGGAQTLSVYRIDERGALNEIAGSPFNVEGEPTELAIDHSGAHLFVAAEGREAILAFSIDEATGELRTVPGSPFRTAFVPAGMAVGNGDDFLYVSYASDHSVGVLKLNGKTGVLSQTSQYSVPAGAAPGRLAVSASGAQLFVANTGSDSVSAFEIDPAHGSLTPVPGSPFAGLNSPRDLAAAIGGVYVAGSQNGGLSRIAAGADLNERSSAQVWQVSALDATVLAADASGEFLFAANAGANTLTRYRIDSQTGEFSSGSAQSFATGANPSGIALVNAPKPLVTGTISVSLASESLLTFASTTGQVTISAAAVNGGKAGCAGQVIQVSFSVPSIGVITVGTSTTPVTSVCVLTGKTSAAFNVTTAATSGSAVLTAFETGFTDGTTNLSVSLRTITLTLPYTNIGVGHTVTGSVTLANPAPAGGVTIALASSAVAAATVSPHTVTIAGGASTAAFTVTGVQANTATLSAKVASGGYSPGSIGITVLPPGLTINLPHNAVVAPGQSLPYPITIGAAAASAVSVTLKVSGGPGTATFAPNPVTIPAGATTPATAPTIKGVHIGPLEVTGSATGYAPDTEAATVQITLTFNPDTLNVETGKIADLVLSASAIAPVGGFTIDLKSSVPGFATVPTSIVIAAGTSTVKVPVTGVAAGATTITASAPGAITATAAVTAFAPPGITLYGPTGTNAFTVGKNGVVSISGTLAQAAPAHNLTVTLTTPASSNLLLSTTATGTGSHSIAVLAASGSTSIPAFYAQALASSGTTDITATATGYSPGTAAATFTPSGFIVEGGTATSTLSATSPVTVSFAQLDPKTLAFTGGLTLRMGTTAVTVPLTDSDTAVGTVSASVVFKPGESSVQATFKPIKAGSAIIGFGTTPAGYSAATSYSTTTFTVTAPNTGISFCNGYSVYSGVTTATPLGYYSSCSASANLYAAAPKGGRTVTLKSSNPKVLLLSTSATTVGLASITLDVPAGSTSTPTFYVQSLASSGSATITETVPSYNETKATIDFTPSGFIVEGGTATTTFSTASTVTVYFAQLDPKTHDFTGGLTLTPGAPTLPVVLKETDTPTGVGSLGTKTLDFKAGDMSHSTTYQPSGIKPGTSVIGFASTLAGYTAPGNYATTTFTVTAPNSAMNFCNGYSVYTGSTTAIPLGYNSACFATPSLYAAAPKGGSAVKLTSNSADLLLSTSATEKGTSSITVNVPAGSTTGPTFYVQTLASTGSAKITETVAGYNPTIATIDFTPSGFIVQGGGATTTFSGTSPVTVTFAQLDPTSLAFTGGLTLRPGLAALSVGLTKTDTPAGVGSLASASIVFNSGDSYHSTTYQPTGNAAGTSVIAIARTLPGYAKPSDYATTTFTVTAPNTSLNFCNGYSVYSGSTTAIPLGYNSSCASSAYLYAAAPAGGRTITLTSSDSTKLLLSTGATAVGKASITLTVAAGSTSSAAFYVQSKVSTASATITETVSGYNPTTATINFVPSGFIVEGGTATTTFSGSSPVNVYFAQLDPTTLDYTGQLTLRPGLKAVTVKLIDTNTPSTGTPPVGSLAASSLTFNSGDTTHTVNFQPAAAGTAVISFGTTPAGYTTPSNYFNTTFTVTAPNTSIGFCNGYSASTGSTTAIPLGYNSSCSASPSLGAPAPAGGRTITLKSSDASKLLLSTSASTVGSASITVSAAAGSSSGTTFYIQSLASTGSATITETAPGYNSTVATVDFTPSGFIVEGGTPTTTFSGTSPVEVYFAQLDPSTLAFTSELTLRPGASATVVLTETDTPSGVGSLGSSSLVFNAGDAMHSTTYQPTGTATGTSVIGFKSTLTGYSKPSNYDTTTFTVTAPAIYLQPATVGNYMQISTYGSLAIPLPTSRMVTISAPSSGPPLLLSTSESTKGTSSLSFSLAAGSSSIPTFYVQSQGGYVQPSGGGAVTINLTVSTPGYADGTGVITLYPSGFALQNSNFTTTTGENPTTLTIVPAALDPTYLTISQVQELVPNVDALLSALTHPSTPTGTLVCAEQEPTTGACPAGTFSVGSVTFKGNDNPNSLNSSFVPDKSGTGTFLISITSPNGFTSASTDATATVNAP